MSDNVSKYIAKFNAYYSPIRESIGNIGVIAAGIVLIVSSLFISTDVFGLLLDLFGALGVLLGICVFLIGVVMLGIEKRWWSGPAALDAWAAKPVPTPIPTPYSGRGIVETTRSCSETQ